MEMLESRHESFRMEQSTTPNLILLIGSGSVTAGNMPGLTHLIAQHLELPTVVVLTKAASRFVTHDALLHLGNARMVLSDETPDVTAHPNHIWLASQARAVLVYPASAGFIGRMANGLASDLASTTILCCSGRPILLVPSMNPLMWQNRLVQRNISLLIDSGIQVMPTENGIAPDVYEVQKRLGRVLRETSDQMIGLVGVRLASGNQPVKLPET